MEEQQAIFNFILRDKIDRDIVRLLTEVQTIEQIKLPKIINKSKGTIYYHIKTLKEQELVFSEKSKGNLEISLNPKYKELIMNIIENIDSKLMRLKEKTGVEKEKELEKNKVEIKEEIEASTKRTVKKEKEKEKKEETRQKSKTF